MRWQPPLYRFLLLSPAEWTYEFTLSWNRNIKQKTSTLEPKETFLYSGGVVSRYKTKPKEQNNKCIFITTNALCRIILDNTTFLSRYVISDELLNFPLAPETDKLIKKKMNDRINYASCFAVRSNSSLRQQSHASGKVATNENINNIQICFFFLSVYSAFNQPSGQTT